MYDQQMHLIHLLAAKHSTVKRCQWHCLQIIHNSRSKYLYCGRCQFESFISAGTSSCITFAGTLVVYEVFALGKATMWKKNVPKGKWNQTPQLAIDKMLLFHCIWRRRLDYKFRSGLWVYRHLVDCFKMRL